MRTCKNCNIQYQDNVKFCSECGCKTEEPKLFTNLICQQCSTEIEPGVKFCSECGASTNLVSDNKAVLPPPPIFQAASSGMTLPNILNSDSQELFKLGMKLLLGEGVGKGNI